MLLLPTHHTTSPAQARRLVLALARAIGEQKQLLVPDPVAPVRMPIYDL